MGKFQVHKGIHIDFAHHIRGHDGACINIHGHTWFFEVAISAVKLSELGFVVDFKQLKEEVLKPCHELLDHSFSLSKKGFEEVKEHLKLVNRALRATQASTYIEVDTPMSHIDKLDKQSGVLHLNGAELRMCGANKVTTFPFAPTSELLSKWLFSVATDFIARHSTREVALRGLKVEWAKVYETIHPVESVATYYGD